MADAAEEADLVGLEALARAAAVSEPAPGELAADLFCCDRQSGREPLDDGDEGAPVRLSGGQVAQHRRSLRPGARARDLAEARWRPGPGRRGRPRAR